jgi:simple sugar transport system substrate-binding protein
MRKSRKLSICFLFIFLFMSALLIAEVAAQEDYTMISIPKLRATWFDRMEVGLIEAGKEYGINVSQQAPASADEAQQVRMMEDAINQGNNAILVVPNDANSIVPAFARAQNKGIVTITHESPQQQNADFDVEMIDNVAFGEKAMELMVKDMGTESGKYAVFVGSLTVPAHNIWADAAIVLAEKKYPGLESYWKDRSNRYYRTQSGKEIPRGWLYDYSDTVGSSRGRLRYGLSCKDRT